MGNKSSCFSPKAVTVTDSEDVHVKTTSNKVSSSSSSSQKVKIDDSVIQQQAIAAFLLFKQQQQKNNDSDIKLDRSTSVQCQLPPSIKQPHKLPRSSSTSQQGSVSKSLCNHLIDQDFKIDELETKRFVLVHGGGYGAWCWYKTISLLQDCGFQVDAVDLTGSGVHSCDTSSITSLAQYAKPLVDLLDELGLGEKVILVGHDLGGICISYAMEMFHSKVCKAVFIAATMLNSGQSALATFAQQAGTNDVMRQAQKFLYANGKDHPPTAVTFDKAVVADLLFNQSPSKDVVLASVSMRPIPFAPITEKVALSEANYGSIQRFYIKTQEDFSIPVPLQEAMIASNTPQQVFQIKGSDHSPFFSRPQALHKLLIEISKIPAKQV
jgi:pimeloyl-ACP methyl ester carboxylesterase